MTGDGPKIVIEGTRKDWPGGPRTLTPLDPVHEPNKQTYWFGAELAPDRNQVWFRVTMEAVRQMQGETPGTRGNRLLDALLAWMTPDRPLSREFNRFQVRIRDNGDTWIEPYGA